MAASGTSFKPGNTASSATTFKPGVSANPGGRRKNPEAFAQFRDYLRTYSTQAAEALVLRALGPQREDGTFDYEKGSEHMLVTLLAYQHGKPAQSLTGEGGEGAAIIQILTGVPRASE